LSNFILTEGLDTNTLQSRANNAIYNVGKFSTPTMEELRNEALAALEANPDTISGAAKLTNVVGDAAAMIRDNRNCVS